jgi:hypothetical protein
MGFKEVQLVGGVGLTYVGVTLWVLTLGVLCLLGDG